MENNDAIKHLYFSFNIAKTEDAGEDADPIYLAYPKKMYIGVADGLGGAGSTMYDDSGKQRSGAYLASRAVLDGCLEFCKELSQPNQFLGDELPIMKERLKACLEDRLKLLKYEASGLRSKLIRRLPTTLALGEITYTEDNNFALSSVWAGDSRMYILMPDANTGGLLQLSIDHLKEKIDPFDNLRKDAPLSNFISLDGDFYLDNHPAIMQAPFIALVATDGCYGYLPTPMHFEELLLQTLMDSANTSEWRDTIVSKLKNVAGDDISMALVAIGYDEGEFEKLKACFSDRHKQIQLIIFELNDVDRQYQEKKRMGDVIMSEIQQLDANRQLLMQTYWGKYKPTYYDIEKQRSDEER